MCSHITAILQQSSNLIGINVVMCLVLSCFFSYIKIM